MTAPALPTALFTHAAAPLCAIDTGTLAGLRHRTVIDRSHGASSLALWQEEHLPGFRVPLHLHDCEEIITVIEGTIVATTGGEPVEVHAGMSWLIPPMCPHGFSVQGPGPVRLLALFGSADPQVLKCDGTPSLPPWAGGTPAQFDP